MAIIDKIYTSGKLRNEGAVLEYKENFDWQNKESRARYAKTIAGFANNKGGILVFGVTDKPRQIVGLSNVQKSAFEKIDESVIERFYWIILISLYLFPRKHRRFRVYI